MLIGLYFVINNKTEDKAWKRGAIQRMAISSILGLTFYFLPNFFWFDIMYRNHPQYIEATKNLYTDPGNEDFRIQVEEEREKMNNGI